MNKEYEYAIVGGGPAGIVFHNELSSKHNIESRNIVLFEKGQSLCSDVLTYGKFVRNHGADEITKWDFLVDGNYFGPQMAEYFQEKFKGAVVYSEVEKIIKVGSIYQLLTKGGELHAAENVILATGAQLKEIDAVKNLPNQEFNISNISTEKLKEIDFLKHELILIGSGDKTLLKAARVARYIEETYPSIPHIPTKIFVKNKFADHSNPEFLSEVSSYVEKGIIQIIDDCWQIEEVKLRDNHLVDRIICQNRQYLAEAHQGAYVGVFIGLEGKWPTLVNCNIEDFVCIGDLCVVLSKKKINIPAALLDAEQKAGDI